MATKILSAGPEAAFGGREALTVSKVATNGATRVLTLSDGRTISLHRFAAVGKGDTLRVGKRPEDLEVAVKCKNGEAIVAPFYQSSVTLPGLSDTVYLKEISNERELEAYERLASYHYRNHASFGRRAIIIARVGVGSGSKIVGYVEITNSFSGHQARNKVLDAPFSDGSVSWDRWGVDAKKLYLNSIARISRCVVHPEYRGLGLGKALCTAAITYTKRSWQIAGLKPLFLEITADMLKFVPFAKKAGMDFIGTTSGNLKRLVKDQTYLKGVKDDISAGLREAGSHAVFAEGAKSILQRQRRDLGDLQKLSDERGVDILALLKLHVAADSAEQMPSSTYELLHRFIRFPKPTYMVGLTQGSSAFLRRRLTELQIRESKELPDLRVEPLRSGVEVRDLTISHFIPVPEGQWSNALQEAFGIHQNSIAQTGIRKLSASVRPREVFYIWGASGSGKSILLEAIRGQIKPTEGVVSMPIGAKIGTLELDFVEQPVVIEAGGRDINESLYALGMVGLSEANLYFKNPSHLSNGQRYRLALAKLILSRSNVWIIDEFCSVLDDSTAELIAWNVGKFARRLGVTAIIAGPRRNPVLPQLQPDEVLELDSLGDWRIKKGYA